jgi:hypothetical protein
VVFAGVDDEFGGAAEMLEGLVHLPAGEGAGRGERRRVLRKYGWRG